MKSHESQVKWMFYLYEQRPATQEWDRLLRKGVRNWGRADGPKSKKMSEMEVRLQFWASNNACKIDTKSMPEKCMQKV